VLTSDPYARACAVCGRVLEAVVDAAKPDGEPVDYQHSTASAPDELDHQAVPVPYGEIPQQLRPRCDFCHEDFPTHTVVSIPLRMPGTEVHWDAEWAACELCASLIESNQWPLLTRRAIAAFNQRYGALHRDTETDLRVVIYQLRKNLRDFYRGLEKASD
jgi:hypothetical protein